MPPPPPDAVPGVLFQPLKSTLHLPRVRFPPSISRNTKLKPGPFFFARGSKQRTKITVSWRSVEVS